MNVEVEELHLALGGTPRTWNHQSEPVIRHKIQQKLSNSF